MKNMMLKTTLEKALDIFKISTKAVVKGNKALSDKITLLWYRLYKYDEEFKTAVRKRDEDAKEINKSFSEEINAIQALEEKEKNEKMNDLNRRFNEKVSELASEKALPLILKKEIEVELPTFTLADLDKIREIEGFEALESVSPLHPLVEVESQEVK